MKRILLTILMLCATVVVMAGEYKYITIDYPSYYKIKTISIVRWTLFSVAVSVHYYTKSEPDVDMFQVLYINGMEAQDILKFKPIEGLEYFREE